MNLGPNSAESPVTVCCEVELSCPEQEQGCGMLSGLTDAFLRAKCCSEYGDPWLTLPDIVSVLHIHRLMLFRDWQSSLSNLIFTDAFGLLRVVLVGCCLFFFFYELLCYILPSLP